MILKIEGSDKKIAQIARELKTRARRANLKITIEKSEEAKPTPDPETEKLPRLVVDLIALIEKVENLEDLKKFEADKRATVVEAVSLKREELDLR